MVKAYVAFEMVRFSEVVKDKIDITHEGYELKFLGKNYSKILASLDTESGLLLMDILFHSICS